MKKTILILCGILLSANSYAYMLNSPVIVDDIKEKLFVEGQDLPICSKDYALRIVDEMNMGLPFKKYPAKRGLTCYHVDYSENESFYVIFSDNRKIKVDYYTYDKNLPSDGYLSSRAVYFAYKDYEHNPFSAKNKIKLFMNRYF